MLKTHETLNEFALHSEIKENDIIYIINITITEIRCLVPSFFFRSVSSDFPISLKNPETLSPRISLLLNDIPCCQPITLSLLPDSTTTGYDVCKFVRSRNNQRPTHDVTWTMIPGILSARLLALVTDDARRMQDHNVTSNSHSSLICFRRSGNRGRGRGRVQDRPWLSRILWGSSTCNTTHDALLARVASSSTTKVRRTWWEPPWLFTWFELVYERWKTGGAAK